MSESVIGRMPSEMPIKIPPRTGSPLRDVVRRVPGAATLYRTIREATRYRRFLSEFVAFRAMSRRSAARFRFRWAERYPCLADRTDTTPFEPHYTYHPAWAARILARTRPSQHIDISSTLHFCTIVSAFLPVKFYDYRPADLMLDNLTSGRADLLQLPFADQSVSSLSCMHVVEHIGLGRYGDPLDPDGDHCAMHELQRVLAPGGNLLFVVPVGQSVLRFNAHRIYGYDQVVREFPELLLREFSLITNHPAAALHLNADPNRVAAEEYACGCFWFQRPERARPTT